MHKESFLPIRSQTRKDALAADPLRDYFVWWDDIVQEDVDELICCVNTAKKEQDVQLLLERNPLLLIQNLGGGHGRWVIPQKRLGSEHIPDFIIGEKDSMGFNWLAVELEKPSDKLFTDKGDPTARLNHAYRQITDWRTWLRNNIDYARRSPEKDSLGITDIDGDCNGLIIIGRRANTDISTSQRRKQYCKDWNVKIHTYDWLIEQAQGRVEGAKTVRAIDAGASVRVVRIKPLTDKEIKEAASLKETRW